MYYIFTTKKVRAEIRSWNGRIIETPASYRFLLGKPVSAALEWFKSIGYTMTIVQDKTPPRSLYVRRDED